MPHLTPTVASTASSLEPSTNAAAVMTIPGMDDSNGDRRSHPRGWWSWRNDNVKTITERLATARYLAPFDNGGKRLVHASISPPQDGVGRLSDVYLAAEKAGALALEQNIRGGVLVFHGFRVSDDGKAAYEDAVADREWNPTWNDRNVSDDILQTLPGNRDIDGGIWWWLRKSRTDEWRSLVNWSPHFHCMGLSGDVHENKPDEQDGWVCNRMRSLAPFTLYEDDGYMDMVCTAKHLYTHASFAPGDTTDVTTTWFADTAHDEVAHLTGENDSELAKPTATNISSTVKNLV